jgi:hypothetical protein
MIGDAALFQYKGFYAGLSLVLSLFLLSLRSAPIWIKTISANTGIALASILYLEGAREFRGLSPRSWLAYMGGVVAIGALAHDLRNLPNEPLGGALKPACRTFA